MDGLFGWLGASTAPERDLAAMQDAARAADSGGRCEPCFSATAAAGATAQHGRASVAMDGTRLAAAMGRPVFRDAALAGLAQTDGVAAALLAGWRIHGDALPERLGGSFALALVDDAPAAPRALLALDRMGIERLCWAEAGATLVFATSVQAVAARSGRREIDPQAIYDFLYFHTIPAPRTLYRGLMKLLPGQRLVWDGRAVRTDFYWHADYTPQPASFSVQKQDFRARLDAAVKRHDTPGTAAFLSGGTDSSTVVGATTGVRGAPVDSFSIGFDAAGYDEMDYARCAVDAYQCRAHEYYVKPADIVTGIPLIASAYDEPFGNESAVPTYFCARAAADAGFTRMFAGDGGDEIFGGNARYAKQRLFENYFRLPAGVRRGVIEPLAHLPGVSDVFPFNKLKSYVDQANVRLPLRTESYNFLHRTPLTEIFHGDFLAAVDPGLADRALVEVYARTASEDFVNRMMHLDLKFTLADNDLRKVGGMTEAAGIEVAYPLLDDDLVEFAHHLPVADKVRGQKLRWFFKEALSDLLPQKIIQKSKHGFGLPFGPWCSSHAPLGEIVGDSLADLAQRGWVRAEFTRRLQRELAGPHAGYYGSMVWVLVMLERWLATNP